MSFGAFVQGAMQGASFAQDLKDKYQKGQLRQFEIEKEEEASALRKTQKEVDREAADAVKYAAQGVGGDGMGPVAPEAQPQPTGPVTAEATLPGAAVAQEGVAPAEQVPVGLPAGQVGPGQMRPSAIEAAGATQAPAAAAGTMPQATMPVTTVKPPKDVKKTENFHEARMRIAQERGNSELLGKYTKEYATHLTDQATVSAKKFEAEQRPILEEMARIKTQAEWEALPEEKRAKMLKVQQEVADNSARAGATGWQLVQNPLTRKDGMKLLAHAFGEDEPLKDIQREGDYFLPIGADGKQLVGQDGKPVRVHKDAAERMVSQYGSKAPGIVLAEGAQLRNPNTGALIAENQKDPRPTHEQSTSLAREAGNYVDRALGVQRDQMGNLIAGVTPEQVKASAEVQMRAAEIVRSGKSPEVAAKMAIEEWKAKNAKPGAPGAAPAAAAKPVDTSKYRF